MSESENKNIEIEVPGEWILKKVLGPVLTEFGEDLKRVYAAGRDKIAAAASRKIENLEDGQQANLRVARDVFWNGAFTDEEVCAEYFGGMLASSRSEDGKDDSSIHFVDVIKSLSSGQLELHYLIYSGLNKMFVAKGDRVKVAQGPEIQSRSIWLSSLELEARYNINVATDFNILFRQGLIFEYKTDMVTERTYVFPYSMAKPTTFGVMLYAAAHNQLPSWDSFSSVPFGDFESISNVLFFADTLDKLKKLCGVPSS